MKTFKLLLIFICIISVAQAQRKHDTKIIVTVADVNGLYEKVRLAMINTEFIVKDTHNPDTLTTYVKELNNMPGYMFVNAVISGNTVTLTGIYSLKKLNYFGFTNLAKNVNRVLYYRGSKTWRVLMDVANKIPGTVSFSD